VARTPKEKTKPEFFDDEAEAEVIQAPVEPEPVAPTHSPRLLRLSRELGINPEGMTSDELQDAIDDEARLIAREKRSRQGFFDDQAAKQRQQAPVVQAPVIEEDPLDIDVSELGPELQKFIAGVRSEVKKTKDENKSLREALGGVEGKVQTREAVTAVEVLDGAFAALGDKYIPLFGDSLAQDITGTEEMERRNAMLAIAGIDPKNLSDTKAGLTRRLKAAADKMYGKVLKDPEPAPTQDVVKAPVKTETGPYTAKPNGTAPVNRLRDENGKFIDKWMQAPLAAATNRGHQEPRGDSRAKQVVAEGLNSIASNPDGDHAKLDDFL